MYIRTASANGGQSRIIMIDLAKIEYVGKGIDTRVREFGFWSMHGKGMNIIDKSDEFEKESKHETKRKGIKVRHCSRQQSL